MLILERARLTRPWSIVAFAAHTPFYLPHHHGISMAKRKNARIKAGYTGLHKGYGDEAAWLTRPTGTITAPLEPQIIPPWYCEHLTLRTISVAFRSNGTHATASHAAIILLESSINGL